MRKTMVIPTYWSRRSGEPWQEGDAIYDHPTPVDQEGTLERTLVSMKRFREKDFKLVILVCPTTEDVEEAALAQVRRIVLRSGLGAETYLFTAGDLREIAGILRGAGLDERALRLLSRYGKLLLFCTQEKFYQTNNDYGLDLIDSPNCTAANASAALRFLSSRG